MLHMSGVAFALWAGMLPPHQHVLSLTTKIALPRALHALLHVLDDMKFGSSTVTSTMSVAVVA